MEEKVKKELALYRLREIEIDDMKLKIESLEIEEQIGSISFEERVQTSSIGCKNNDYVMNKIEMLKNKIKANEIANKRVDNSLKRLDSEEDKVVITRIYIDKKSITRTAQELFRTRKSIKKAISRAFEKLELT